MKKIEFIWRHLLYETIEKQEIRFAQQELAAHFGISSSTVNAALTPIRRMGAIRVGGRGFEVVDYEKILYHWANHRDLTADTIDTMRINLPITAVESSLPHATTPTAYTAVRERFGEPAADYDKVYCYTNAPGDVLKRFEKDMGKGQPNLFLLKSDSFLSTYPSIPLSQLFVDLWNLSDWYAKDFAQQVKEVIDGLLS